MNHLARIVAAVSWITLGAIIGVLVLELPRVGWLFWSSAVLFAYAAGCWLLASTCPGQAAALCSLGDMAPARPQKYPEDGC